MQVPTLSYSGFATLLGAALMGCPGASPSTPSHDAGPALDGGGPFDGGGNASTHDAGDATVPAADAGVDPCDGDLFVPPIRPGEQLPACTVVGGNLYIRAGLMKPDVTIDDVQEVKGLVNAEVGVARLTFTALQRIGGNLQLPSTLQELEAPGLTQVGGSIGLTGTSLTRFALPELHDLGGDLGATDVAALESISLPKLVNLGSFSSHGCPVLDTVELDQLERLNGSFDVSDAPALQSLSLPALETIAQGTAFTTGIHLLSLTALTALSVPNLADAAGEFSLFELPLLEDLLAPKLVTADRISVTDLPALKRMEFPALADIGSFYLAAINHDMPSLTRIDLSSLQTAEWLAIRSARAANTTRMMSLVDVDLDSLQTVGGMGLDLNDLGAVGTMTLPVLVSVAGDLTVFGAAMHTLNLPELTTLTGKGVFGGGPLTTLTAPKLTSIGSVQVSWGPGTTTCDLGPTCPCTLPTICP